MSWLRVMSTEFWQDACIGRLMTLTITWYLTSSVRYSLPPMMIGTSSVWSRYFFRDSSRAARSGLQGREFFSSEKMKAKYSPVLNNGLVALIVSHGIFYIVVSEI